MNLLILLTVFLIQTVNNLPCNTSALADKCHPDGIYCINSPFQNDTEVSIATCSKCKDNLTLTMDQDFNFDCVRSEDSPCSSSPGCKLCVYNVKGFILSNLCLVCPQGQVSKNGQCVINGECPDGSNACIKMELGNFGNIDSSLHCYSSKTLMIDKDAIMSKIDDIKGDDIKKLIFCKDDNNRCMITVKDSGKERCINCHLNYIWGKENENCTLIKGVIDDGDFSKVDDSKAGFIWLIILLIFLGILIIVGSILGFLYYKKKKAAQQGNLEYLNSERLESN